MDNTILIPPRCTNLLRNMTGLLLICAVLCIVFFLLVLFLPVRIGKPLCLIFFIFNGAFIILMLFWLSRIKKFLKETALTVSCSRDLMWAMDSRLNLTGVWGGCQHIAGTDAMALLNKPLASILPEDAGSRFITFVRDNKPFSMECRIANGENMTLPVKIKAFPIHLSGHNTFHGIITDFTNQKRIQALESELDRSKKLKKIGLLAGSIVHDLNNILSGMATYPEILLLNPALDPEVRRSLTIIKESGQNASAVVSDLLTIARGIKEEYQVLNINKIIERFMASSDFKKMQTAYSQVKIDIYLEPELLTISGSYMHIEKSIRHLMLNALESAAATDGGNATIMISTANHYADSQKDTKLPPGEYVMLEVMDTGKCIPEEYLNKIFEPFFTQKEMGRPGSGLGLTVVKNTVLNHRGKIFVTSDEKGTKFTLLFPALRPEMSLADQPASIEEIQGNGETILVVDDLASQRKIAETILKNLGYKVFSVADGISAIDFIMQTPVDLLILDMVMAPSISGLETYRQIKKNRPDQKAIIASGHSQSEDVLKALSEGAGAFVKKPYTILDMGIAVKEELDR